MCSRRSVRRPLATKLLAFAVSSFYIGVGGAINAMVYRGFVDPSTFELLAASFPILFMIIIGGLGSILGTYFGVGFIVVMPVILRNVFTSGWSTWSRTRRLTREHSSHSLILVFEGRKFR